MASWVSVVVGLVLLVLGAELIVRFGARLARRLGIPPILVGLTVVSIGTSAPELAVGIGAARSGEGSLALGNIAGTNLVNILLILGLSAAIRAIPMALQTLRLDLPVMGAVALLVLVFAVDGVMTRVEGGVLVGVAIGYTIVLVRWARRESARVVAEFESAYRVDPRPGGAGQVVLIALMLVIGLVIVVLGADWLVIGAVDLAASFGVSSALIGLTIVAIGTSAPELATAVLSTLRGDRDIAIGNLIGSSTYNLTLILGVTLLAAPIVLDPALVLVDLPVMIAATLACGAVMLSGRKLTRLEGAGMMVAYLVYLGYLLVART